MGDQILVHLLGRPVEHRGDLDQAIAVQRDRLHAGTEGGVTGAHGGEPHLGVQLAQRTFEGFELHFTGEGFVARVIDMRGEAIDGFTVGTRALRQIDDAVQVQLARHLIGEAIGGIGVVAVVHPHDRDVRTEARHHVQNHRLEGTEVGGADGVLVQRQSPAGQGFRVVAEFGIDAGEIEGIGHEESPERGHVRWSGAQG